MKQKSSFYYRYLSWTQKRELVSFIEQPLDNLPKGSAAYNEAYKFNSYIKTSKDKVKKNKIEVKIRIPETPGGQSRLNAIWNQIVDKVSRMNGRAFALSSNKAGDPYFYVIEGTRIKH